MTDDRVITDVVLVVRVTGAAMMIVGGFRALVDSSLAFVRPGSRTGAYKQLRC